MRQFSDSPIEGVPCLVASVAGDGLKTVCLCPDGAVKSRKGTFVLDVEAARMVVGAFEEHGVDVPIDFEHQTLGGEFSSPTGRAPAAGWITKLWYEAGRGLLALVGWTESARSMIQAGEYCYLSPVLSIRPEDRRVRALHSAALTNKPAIPRVERVAAKDTDVTLDREIVMADDETKANDGGNASAEDLLRRIKALLGLTEAMTASEILQKVLKKLEEGESTADGEVAASVRHTLGLAADAGRDEVVLAMRLGESRQETAEVERQAKAMVDQYLADGKLNPRDTEGVAAAMSLARENPQRLTALMANASVVMPPQGRTNPPDPATAKRDQAIRMAVMSFRDDPKLAAQTTLEAAVDLVLRDNGFPKLSEGELTRFV